MSEAKEMPSAPAEDATPDLLNALVGVAADSPLAALRAQRAEIAGFIEASYAALLEPADEDDVPHAERGLVALRAAYLDECEPLVTHYRAYLTRYHVEAELIEAALRPALDAPLSPRLIALLAHVDRLMDAPDAATPQHLADLKRHGLTDGNIVTISQLIAFVSFQTRTLVGLQLLTGGR